MLNSHNSNCADWLLLGIWSYVPATGQAAHVLLATPMHMTWNFMEPSPRMQSVDNDRHVPMCTLHLSLLPGMKPRIFNTASVYTCLYSHHIAKRPWSAHCGACHRSQVETTLQSLHIWATSLLAQLRSLQCKPVRLLQAALCTTQLLHKRDSMCWSDSAFNRTVPEVGSLAIHSHPSCSSSLALGRI